MTGVDVKVKWELPDDEVMWKDIEKHWDEHDEDDYISRVKRGMQGLNEGLDNGLVRINTYLHGTHRGRYILIGAESGAGKTTLASFMYVYSLWKDCKRKGIKLYIKYFSFEMSATEMKNKWVVMWIHHIYKVDLDAQYIMGGISDHLLTEEHFKMVQRGYDVVSEMMKDITMIDTMLHPTGILNKLIEDHYEKIGTVHRDPVKDGKKKGYIRGYTPKDPTAMTVMIVDHWGLINTEHGATTIKGAMDRTSMYAVHLRNLFDTTVVALQQFSSDMMASYRDQKKSESAIAPSRLDFGDSKYTFRDADIVMGLVSPLQFDLKTFQGYDIQQLGKCFLVNYLMKNRYGASNRALPLFLNPISGMFMDMPPSPTHPDMIHFINEAKYVERLCQQFSSQQGTNP